MHGIKLCDIPSLEKSLSNFFLMPFVLPTILKHDVKYQSFAAEGAMLVYI